jgi:hypothetical protein
MMVYEDVAKPDEDLPFHAQRVLVEAIAEAAGRTYRSDDLLHLAEALVMANDPGQASFFTAVRHPVALDELMTAIMISAGVTRDPDDLCELVKAWSMTNDLRGRGDRVLPGRVIG